MHMETRHAPRARAKSHTAGDVDWRRQAELTPEHLSRLLELSRALAGACEHAEVAIIVAERARALTGASAAQVLGPRDGASLAVIAEAMGVAPPGRPSTPASIPRTALGYDVVLTGDPIWIRARTEASDQRPDIALDTLPGGPQGASWAFLPLVADEETNGVLTLVFDDAQAFDDVTRAFVGEVAAACGSALARGSLFSHARARANASEEARATCEARQRRSDGQFADRTRLYERERFARARAEAETVVAVHAADDLERVQPLTRALFSAETAADVIAALVEHGPDAFGAVSVELTPRDVGGGAPAPGEGRAAEAEVLRAGAPLWLDPKELVRRFPDAAAALRARGCGSWLGVPVPGDGGVDAVLSLAFPRERAFTPGDRNRLELLASECASVLARCSARDTTASAQADRDAAAARPPDAFVVQYEEVGVDGPATRVLGVFSSEHSARQALGDLERTRSLVVHASITSWTVDVARSTRSIEIDLEP
jgi:hypothetical protein